MTRPAPESETQPPAGAAPAEKIRSALLRYRVMAWVTGIWLILLCAEMVLKYLVQVDWPIQWIPPLHGFFYFVYVLATFDLAVKVRWPIAKTVGVLLAGTVPVLGIIVEHFQTRDIKTQFGL
jgi:integral membrane protein